MARKQGKNCYMIGSKGNSDTTVHNNYLTSPKSHGKTFFGHKPFESTSWTTHYLLIPTYGHTQNTILIFERYVVCTDEIRKEIRFVVYLPKRGS